MSFLRRIFKGKKVEDQPSTNKNSMLVMESDTLGMTVIQENSQSSGTVTQITNQQWVDMINNNGLEGVSYNRIYFSFLKGIPTFLRMKIWLLLCTQNSSRNYKFTGVVQKKYSQEIKRSSIQRKSIERNSMQQKQQQAPNKNKQIFNIFTIQVFKKLSTSPPQPKQVEQINKDIHRSYSNKMKYKYTEDILRRLLYSLSNSGVQYSQGMNYILLNLIIYCLQSLGIKQSSIDAVSIQIQRDMFIVMREIVLRLQEVFDNNNIMKVLKELQEKIAETVPEILYQIYQMGMDIYSLFSQHYYSVLTYNDPPQQLCKQMFDLFFLEGEKAITSMIVRMLEIAQKQIIKIKDPETFQQFLKVDIFHYCFRTICEEKQDAKSISDFGLSFYNNISEI